ncbi:hypothetical protein BCD_0905 (plasmid) [Borrelia crocidurae DOU]|uniref:Uncharacterized protein n=1 Tax=Borrelia crocidurae DOU TaxID=1293575 RepID=W5SPF3_9SPIR|nr:hypothetical protein BCD_0905 [Borrelia crocidurae DOU]
MRREIVRGGVMMVMGYNSGGSKGRRRSRRRWERRKFK